MGRHSSDNRTCQHCHKVKSKIGFYRNGGGWANVCKLCNSDDVLFRSYIRMGPGKLEKRIQRLENQYFTALKAAQKLALVNY